MSSEMLKAWLYMCVSLGTYVTQVTATDADDPTYGNSARIVYSILHGQPYFSVDPKTGEMTALFYNKTKSYPNRSVTFA